MKVSMPTVEVTDDFRRIIAWYQSDRKGDPRKHRLATRDECRFWLVAYGQNLDTDASYEFEEAVKAFEYG